jgi:hypothetical protein
MILVKARVNLEEKDKEGRTVLYRTAAAGSPGFVSLFLRYGASVTTTAMRGIEKKKKKKKRKEKKERNGRMKERNEKEKKES